MSSKVLRGDAAQSAEPIAWHRVTPVPPIDCAPEPVPEEALSVLQARVAELEREIVLREQRAHEAGCRKGKAEAEEQAAGRLQLVLDGFAKAAADLASQRKRMRREAEEDLLKLSLAIARRVLHREVSVDPEAVLGIVKAALEKVEAREVDCIRIHAEDAGIVERYFEQIGLSGHIRISADPHLPRGSAILDTARGSLDASIETQLQEIQRGLLDKVQRGP